MDKSPEHKDDKRKEVIERLERAVADEREHSATLRRTVEDLTFKIGVLEQSYSKQLEDARRRFEAAEQRAADLAARVAEFESTREDAVQLLTDAKIELDRLTAERDQLRKQLASRDGWQADNDDFEIDSAEGTINALMNDATWQQKRLAKDEKREEQPVDAADEPAEEMISPDLVLSGGRTSD